MSKVAMISQPINGLTDDQIKAAKENAAEYLKDQGYEVLNTFFEEEWTKKENMEKEGVKQIPVRFLAKSIEAMSMVDAVYFCSGWQKARGCKIEHDIAESYGLKIFTEDASKIVDRCGVTYNELPKVKVLMGSNPAIGSAAPMVMLQTPNGNILNTNITLETLQSLSK